MLDLSFVLGLMFGNANRLGWQRVEKKSGTAKREERASASAFEV